MLNLLAWLLVSPVPDAWVGPVTGSPALTTKMVTPYWKRNTTGNPIYFGGNNPGYGPVPVPTPPGTPTQKYTLNFSISMTQGNLNGWGMPDFTSDFCPEGDNEPVTKTVIPPTTEYTVQNGETYYHNIWIQTATSQQTFSGTDSLGNHQAGRWRGVDTVVGDCPYVSSTGNLPPNSPPRNG